MFLFILFFSFVELVCFLCVSVCILVLNLCAEWYIRIHIDIRIRHSITLIIISRTYISFTLVRMDSKCRTQLCSIYDYRSHFLCQFLLFRLHWILRSNGVAMKWFQIGLNNSILCTIFTFYFCLACNHDDMLVCYETEIHANVFTSGIGKPNVWKMHRKRIIKNEKGSARERERE